MKLRDLFGTREPDIAEVYANDIRERAQRNIDESTLVPPAVKASVASGRRGRRPSPKRTNETIRLLREENEGNWSLIRSSSGEARTVRSPYRYDRINSFFRTEAYFARSVNRQIETMLRNGCLFVGDDVDMLIDLQRELRLLCRTSYTSIERIIYAMGLGLLKNGVVMIEKVRGKASPASRSSLANLRFLDAQMTGLHIDEVGRITGATPARSSSLVMRALATPLRSMKMKFSPSIGGAAPTLKASDFIFIPIYDAGMDIFPIPPCWPTLDDIMTMRSFEETLELISFQYSSPLVHFTVGTADEEASPEEVQAVHTALVSMASNGFITTNSRVKGTAINLQNAVPDILPAIEYFKGRVLSGSGSSSISVGETDTTNRNTAESIDEGLADRCAAVSSVIASAWNDFIIPDVLLSMGYVPDRVYTQQGESAIKLVFNEVRIEKTIALGNHALALYHGNAITRAELRSGLRYPAMKPGDEDDTYLNRVQLPLKAGGADDGGSTGAVNPTTTTPQNQYGTKASPGTRKN